ncbi:hypothetical protein QBC41DRAFT_321688 [Cercophora samala]|uniref:Uncharacterized protein n=1 Tax=Cercophora samala TaxID=330535 RepID=A0AA39ZCL8_9PEZI|nr:hypothetical protein QBC41DRAFT_321688 [Cercophora samala]
MGNMLILRSTVGAFWLVSLQKHRSRAVNQDKYNRDLARGKSNHPLFPTSGPMPGTLSMVKDHLFTTHQINQANYTQVYIQHSNRQQPLQSS